MTVTVTFAGSGDAFGSGGRFQAVSELEPGQAITVDDVTAQAFEASHPSGAPALILRLTIAGVVIAYTGDTAWVPAIASAAADADLLIAEAYFWDKAVPHHLRYADLAAHETEISARRIIRTHMSADMLAHREEACAYDGLVVRV
jgi:ribonuclease BN (tRNA processing enzyme)